MGSGSLKAAALRPSGSDPIFSLHSCNWHQNTCVEANPCFLVAKFILILLRTLGAPAPASPGWVTVTPEASPRPPPGSAHIPNPLPSPPARCLEAAASRGDNSAAWFKAEGKFQCWQIWGRILRMSEFPPAPSEVRHIQGCSPQLSSSSPQALELFSSESALPASYFLGCFREWLCLCKCRGILEKNTYH